MTYQAKPHARIAYAFVFTFLAACGGGPDAESILADRIERAGAPESPSPAGGEDAAVAPPHGDGGAPSVTADAGAPGADAGPEPSPPPTAAWRPFSADSPWNQRIPADVAIRPDSDALISDLSTSSPWPGLLINIHPWSVPVFEADGSSPRASVRTPLSNEGEGMTFDWPVPTGATADPELDGHLTVIDRAAGRAYDFYQGRPTADGSWDCTLCSTVDLNGTGVRPPKGGDRPWYESHGSRACGFPLIAGLIRPEEIAAGRIDHALVIAYPALRQRWFRSPASTGHPDNGIISEHTGIPCGGRVQLDPAVDVDALDLPPAGRTIARALQEYGAYVGDFSGSINLYADGSESARRQWEGVLTSEAVRGLDLSRLRVVEWGELRPDG